MENKEILVIAKYEIAYRNKIYSAGKKFMMLEKDLKGDYKNDVIVVKNRKNKIQNLKK